MGCFNAQGFLSKLPILCGDEVIAFLALTCVNGESEIYSFENESLFYVPIAFPIYGRYNDYGGIHEINEDYNVKKIEKFFDCDMERIIMVLDDVACGRCYEGDSEYKEYEGFIDKLRGDNNYALHYNRQNTRLTFCMERKDVYDMVSGMKPAKGYYWSCDGINWEKEFQKNIEVYEYKLKATAEYNKLKEDGVDENTLMIKWYDIRHKCEEMMGRIHSFTLQHVGDSFTIFRPFGMMLLYYNDEKGLLYDMADENIKFAKFYDMIKCMGLRISTHYCTGQYFQYKEFNQYLTGLKKILKQTKEKYA